MSPPDDGDREPSDETSSDSPSSQSGDASPDAASTGSGDLDDAPTGSPSGADDTAGHPADGEPEPGSTESESRRPERVEGGTNTGSPDDSHSPGEPRARPVGLNGEPADDRDEGMDWTVFVYDIVNSAVAVLLVGALLFAVSGVWPPMVAVESPSMTPHMETGDLVFVMEETRFPGEGAREGVVTARTGQTTDVHYRKFGRQGDVIVYRPDGDGDTTPIIHRAMFWVEEGENWYDEADRQAVGRYERCGESVDEALPNCPAPHAGFITKGDANSRYDQVDGLSGPVKPAWVVGTAEVRIPLLGCIRLRSDRCSFGTATLVGATSSGTNATLPGANETASGTGAAGR